MEKKYCVYRHVRLDKDETFYIGIGNRKKRPYDKSGRSDFWKRITTKTDYRIDIICEEVTWEQAVALEKSLIFAYGRRDLGTGTLVNLTEGGEGTVGIIVSEEKKASMSLHRKGKKLSEQHLLNRIAAQSTEEVKIAQALAKAKKVIDLETGIIYPSAKVAAEVLGFKKATLTQRLNGRMNNNTTLRYYAEI